ncbi:MAG: gas vesicle protein GvpG [Acidobacteriia bacterium]|nr:gas vesicle protein GvpG [Terriglobia bacterium]
MILVDDILLAPFRGLRWIFEEIHHAAHEEIANGAESITAELSTLYMMLETGKITEQEFAQQEKLLLDRLDQIQRPAPTIE